MKLGPSRHVRGAVLAAAVTAGAVAALALAARDGDDLGEGRALTDAHVADVKAAALEFAASSGDPSPSSGHLIISTRREAVSQMLGARVDSDQEVFVVQLTGNFVGHAAPYGMAAPTGTALLLVLDAKTLRPVDWSITGAPTNLRRLGVPHRFIG